MVSLYKNNLIMNTETPVKKIKNSKVVYVNAEDMLSKVEDIFDQMPIHHILVLDGLDLKGIISKHDLLKFYQKAVNEGILLNRNGVKAKDIMTTNPITLDIEDTIGLAASIFLSNKIHSIPLMDGDHLAGIITNHDIIKYCFG
jgi:CBS domain-containing protein